MERHKKQSLKKDYDFCEAIIKKHSKSFYYAFSRLPKVKARAVFAIYAFCRIADDSVDTETSEEKQVERLAILESELEAFQKGLIIDHPIWRALRDVFDRYSISFQPFFDQLKGQKMDIHYSIPETIEDLEAYSYFVAGSVGLMLLPILASETSHDLTASAVSLGIAMQLTNILRDVGEDYKEKGRIYLPSSEMTAAAYTGKKLDEKIINDSFISIWEKLAVRAEVRYEQFQESILHFDKDSRFPVLLSANIYRNILNTVRQNDYDCFTRKNVVGPAEFQRIYQKTMKILKSL